MVKSFTSQVVSMGRITIPSEIRRQLNIKEGDHVEVKVIRKLVLVEERAVELAPVAKEGS